MTKCDLPPTLVNVVFIVAASQHTWNSAGVLVRSACHVRGERGEELKGKAKMFNE